MPRRVPPSRARRPWSGCGSTGIARRPRIAHPSSGRNSSGAGILSGVDARRGLDLLDDISGAWSLRPRAASHPAAPSFAEGQASRGNTQKGHAARADRVPFSFIDIVPSAGRHTAWAISAPAPVDRTEYARQMACTSSSVKVWSQVLAASNTCAHSPSSATS